MIPLQYAHVEALMGHPPQLSVCELLRYRVHKAAQRAYVYMLEEDTQLALADTLKQGPRSALLGVLYPSMAKPLTARDKVNVHETERSVDMSQAQDNLRLQSAMPTFAPVFPGGYFRFAIRPGSGRVGGRERCALTVTFQDAWRGLAPDLTLWTLTLLLTALSIGRRRWSSEAALLSGPDSIGAWRDLEQCVFDYAKDLGASGHNMDERVHNAHQATIREHARGVGKLLEDALVGAGLYEAPKSWSKGYSVKSFDDLAVYDNRPVPSDHLTWWLLQADALITSLAKVETTLSMSLTEANVQALAQSTYGKVSVGDKNIFRTAYLQQLALEAGFLLHIHEGTFKDAWTRYSHRKEPVTNKEFRALLWQDWPIARGDFAFDLAIDSAQANAALYLYLRGWLDVEGALSSLEGSFGATTLKRFIEFKAGEATW